MRTYHLEAWMKIVVGLAMKIMANLESGKIKLEDNNGKSI